jgi:hypothetical protein
MATVAQMRSRSRSSKAASQNQKNGKLPSFAAEADLFISEEDTEDSPPIKSPSKDKDVGTNVENNEQQQINDESNTAAATTTAAAAEKQITVEAEAKSSSSSSHMEHPASKDQHLLGHKQSVSSPVSPDTTPHTHLTESNMTLREMFDEDDVPFNMSERKNAEPTNQDEWFTGDGDDLLVKQDRLSTTPPLSLYSQKKASSSEADDALESPGYSGATQIVGGDEWSYSASLETSQSGSVATNTQEIPTSSVSSSNNSSAPRSMRPILYSAIGSLENLNSTSMGSLKKRLLSEPREFSRMGVAQSALIPPPKQSKVKNPNSRTRTTSKARSSRAGSDMQPSERVTPPASNTTEQKIGDCGNHTASGQDATKSVDQQPPSETKSRKPSNLRTSSLAAVRDAKGPSCSDRTAKARNSGSKKVSYDKSSLKKKQPIEMFRPSCDAYTPRMEKKRIKYMPAETRTPVQKMASPMGTLQRPNFKDALRRVAMIMHQHIVKIERRFEGNRIHDDEEGLFKASMRDTFCEAAYCTPTYKCTMVRIPMARPGMVYGLRKIRTLHTIPSEGEIYEFAHQLFKSVQLSSECSIVCLIYVERLMEIAKVPLLASTWRPIFMCGLLLASKVWQDLSSWNIEFASVYPQYSLDAINRLEINFLRNVKWDLYISSRYVHVVIRPTILNPTLSYILSLSLYAKYYFALRSLVEKVDFRQRYNRMVGGVDSVAQSEALKIQKRTEQVKEEALNQLSRSM